jgi:hypothetical protein
VLSKIKAPTKNKPKPTHFSSSLLHPEAITIAGAGAARADLREEDRFFGLAFLVARFFVFLLAAIKHHLINYNRNIFLLFKCLDFYIWSCCSENLFLNRVLVDLGLESMCFIQARFYS